MQILQKKKIIPGHKGRHAICSGSNLKMEGQTARKKVHCNKCTILNDEMENAECRK